MPVVPEVGETLIGAHPEDQRLRVSAEGREQDGKICKWKTN